MTKTKCEELIKYLSEYLVTNIPVSQALNIKEISFDGNLLSFQAPLEANINDKQTAFGGSLSSIAILCGWSFIHLHLFHNKLVFDIVISQADIRFLAPIKTDFQTQCSMPKENFMWDKFMSRLIQQKKASIKLDIKIFDRNQQIGAELVATYVALPIIHKIKSI